MQAKRFGYCIILGLLALPTTTQAMLQISKHKTQNMDCSGGVCTPTAQDAVLNVNDLTAMLAAGDLKIFAGGEAVNIKVIAPFGWANRSQLTLSAYQSVLVNAAIVAAGRGGLAVATNTSGQGGDFVLSDSGSVTFWDLRSRFILNGNAYTLVGDIASLASDIAANPSGMYALAKDYDARADGPYARSPILPVFSGSFLGLGHTISNLSILNQNRTDAQVGLFYELGTGSTVSGLTLANVTVNLSSTSGPSAWVGALAGVARGTVKRASVTGSFSGDVWEHIGGLIGINYGTGSSLHAIATLDSGGGGIASDNHGTLSACSASVTITGSGGGGIAVGSAGPISNCHSSGSIMGGGGGLVSYVTGGEISYSYSTASVTASNPYSSGGLIADLYAGEVYECFASGNVSDSVGGRSGNTLKSQPGVVGFNLGGLVGSGSGSGRILESYATGSVTGIHGGAGHQSRVGGVIGYQGEGTSLMQTYATGALSLNKGYLGGVIGYDAAAPGSNKTDLWDTDTTGVSDPSKGAGNIAYDPGLKGETDSQLHRLPKGFDPNVWAVNPNINGGYPYLIANPPPS